MAYDAEGNWIPDPLPFGSPWANDRTGWTPENIDAIFREYAKGDGANVADQTLAQTRRLGVTDQDALNALFSFAQRQNPNMAGASPTGVSRGIWETLGILPQIDSPEMRAAQGREDQQIWQSQQQDDDDFGDLLKIGALGLGAYGMFGGGLGGLGGLFGGSSASSLGGLAADAVASNFASGAFGGGALAEGLGGNMDWFDLPSYADSGGWESWLPDANNVYNPVSANDPIGELIRQLDAGKSSADALKAVESSLPGTTRSALEQFLFEAGSGASNLLKSGASKLFGGSDSTDGFSLSKLLGAVGPGIGGYLASNAQADAYRDIANKQLGEGQWARDMLKQSYADPNAYLQGEGKTFLDDAAKRQAYALSTGGNPIGSGNQMTQMMSDAYARNAGALGQYRGGLTSAGYGVPYQAGSQAQMNAVGQQGAGYNALGSIGSGINDIFNPKPTAAQTLADLLKQAGKIT